jgi:hypothetical protein
MNLLRCTLFALGGLLLSATGANAQTYVNATVDGQIVPGVYGRIQIGNGGPPPLIYAEPVIIHRPPVAIHRSPIYMYVPPGHAKNWGKHCARYNACGQPVYFVQEPPKRKGNYSTRPAHHDHGPGFKEDRPDRGKGRHDRDDHRGNGRGHGGGHKD